MLIEQSVHFNNSNYAYYTLRISDMIIFLPVLPRSTHPGLRCLAALPRRVE